MSDKLVFLIFFLLVTAMTTSQKTTKTTGKSILCIVTPTLEALAIVWFCSIYLVYPLAFQGLSPDVELDKER